MKADIGPIEPLTMMSTPFIEMPQRPEALPSTMMVPPCAVAPSESLALPRTWIRPDIMFSPRPMPALPSIRIVARWFMPPQ